MLLQQPQRPFPYPLGSAVAYLSPIQHAPWARGTRPKGYCPKARERRSPRDTCRQREVIVWDAYSTGFILHASVHEVQHSV
jgi:hypothetical protein